MPLKFRLKGLAETFVDAIRCPCCGHDGGDEGDQGFKTELTRVTYDGIIVVIQCCICGVVFVPDGQRHGVINSEKLRLAVEKDSVTTGQPVLATRQAVKLEVERLNAERGNKVQ
ncbi:MAG: hypothetical protein U0136_12335 [Bdellovibrionota bacterium]